MRLVRLPNGQLVTQQQADDIKELQKLNKKQTELQKEIENKQNNEKLVSQKKITFLNKKTKQKENAENNFDILNVWEKQEQLKKETERLEIEYEIAKKMAKELKRKIKEQSVPHEGQNVEEAFKDLLSPEAKKMAERFKPFASKTKRSTKTAFRSAKISVKKYYKFGKVLAKKNKLVTAGVFTGIIIVSGVVIVNVFDGKKSYENSEVQGTADAKKIVTNVTPDFATLIPANKTIEDLGGFAKVSPENSASAYAFKDKINEIPIIVTQQKLPEGLKEKQKVEDFAKGNNLTKILQVDDKTIYIGLSEKGPQSLKLINYLQK